MVFCLGALLYLLLGNGGASYLDSFRFVILGDRTGSVVSGVYEQVWREAAAGKPAFVVTVGDIIEGGKDATAVREWQEVEQILKPYRRFPLYLTPGNHDIWPAASEQLFRKYAGHPPHYSFDHGKAHFTILDNSRSEDLSDAEMDFLEKDLKAHAAQPVKFIISHRPSWLVNVAVRNPFFPLHQLAKKYGVQYVIAGHVHQLLRFTLQDITYLSMPSSGGHLRNSRKYEDGWFFGHTVVDVRGTDIAMQIQEVRPPHGQGRMTKPADWGMLGLAAR